jgi:uncharacterized protein YbbC (DUF1343 family)
MLRRGILHTVIALLALQVCAFAQTETVKRAIPEKESLPSAHPVPKTVAVAPPLVKFGIDKLQEGNFEILKGKRVGLLTNPSGVNRQGIQTAEILWKSPNVKLVALYGPEHGVWGTVGAGDYVATRKDPKTGLTAFSLYNKTRKPTPEMLSGVDVIVYDLQDIGCRSYTYISSLGMLMEAAAENGKEVVVLDRPNPLGGIRVEGPALNKDFKSFVGQYNIPYVYGLTIGELGKWINENYLKSPCKLTVVKMEGWRRDMIWEDTGLKWKATSPNIPDTQSIAGYVATGVFGELGVTNGANERWPFKIIADEGWDSSRLVKRLKALNTPGIQIREHKFKPLKGKYQNVTFRGAHFTYDTKNAGNLTAFALYGLEIVRKDYPKLDPFRRAKKDKIQMFDKVNGTNKIRVDMTNGVPVSQIVASWTPFVEKWKTDRQKYFLY